MDNWGAFVNLGYGIPKYAVMEILWAMRDKAVPDIRSAFAYFVRYENEFHIQDTHGLRLSLLANARCVGMDLRRISIDTPLDGSLGIHFDRRLRPGND